MYSQQQPICNKFQFRTDNSYDLEKEERWGGKRKEAVKGFFLFKIMFFPLISKGVILDRRDWEESRDEKFKYMPKKRWRMEKLAMKSKSHDMAGQAMFAHRQIGERNGGIWVH